VAQTVGQLLLNDVLPASHQITGPTTKKQLNEKMVDLARKDPHAYVRAIGKLKQVGDAVTTDEGITVGLDDIEPDYKRRDAILEPALAKVRRLQDRNARVDVIQRTQQQMLDVTKKHPGQMTAMALSGARGKPAQLMRSVTTPAAVVDEQNETIPWLISKSYAEGLKPADNWVAMGEARRNAVESYTSVAAPGEMSKILVNNMSDQLITMPDCGTKNGLMMDVNDPNIVDRFRADNGDLITAKNKPRTGSIRVRSPMTCEAPDGVCQKCYGLDTRGAVPRLGHNVGMIAAHAMGEPLTQMSLSAKHATRTAEKQKNVLRGLSGFKQITEIPQSFFNKATLSSQQGTVTAVKKAPQGGHYVHVDEQQHYVPPNLDVLVRKGRRVNAGDALSDGIPKPDEVVKYKGLGEGRKYLADSLHDIYRRTGVDIDKRHFEILAKTDLNYVRMLDRDDENLGVMRGDVLDYNRFRAQLARDAKDVPVQEAVGQRLGNSLLHHTAGVQITPAMAKDFQQSGIKKVPVTPNAPMFEPVMKPISRTPLLHPDFLAKLGHRNLKNVILEGAAFGEMADIHGTHPVPAFVFGEEFGLGPEGRY
jgi:DNA-directed RNA polymerase subunit beta'